MRQTILLCLLPNGDEGVIENTVGTKIRLKVRSSGGVATEPCHIQSVGLIPTTTNTFDIGDVNFKFRNMYATAFNGLATNAINLQVGSNYRTGDVSATNNTVAVRDSSGNLAANVFNGISSHKQDTLTWQKNIQLIKITCRNTNDDRWRS